jgi:cysteinyl-tRNA synthetase
MYVCGMTPKFHPHIGHARLFVAMDVMRRYLDHRGYKLKFVQNFTDVDDKIIQRANSEGRDAQATANAYIDSYFGVMDKLNIRRADLFPTVTGYMERIVEVIDALIENGHAYTVNGDVYFSVDSFPEYGKLSRRDLNSQLVAARKELEPGKRDPRDFALWKRAKEGEPSWFSPWGHGRPGWHIECSAMARETLGDQLDIHGGATDLIFPHHENEIAQSESLTGKKPFVRHWVHTGLLTINGEKMAHSADNFLTAANILERYDALSVRFYLTRTHYRSQLSFLADEGGRVREIEDARAALARLQRAVGQEPLELAGDFETDSVAAFTEAMDADFNAPDAVAAIFDLAREVNRRRDSNADQGDIDRARRTIVHLLGVLGIDLSLAAPAEQQSIEPFVELLLETRTKLREIRQWALADEIRNRLKDLGVEVKDTPSGPTWQLS